MDTNNSDEDDAKDADPIEKEKRTDNLTTIVLDGNNLREVKPDILVAEALGGYKNLSIRDSNISATQLDLLLKMATKSKTMKLLDISNNIVNPVEADRMAGMAAILETIHMENCLVEPHKIQEMLKIAAENDNIKSISLRGVDLRFLHPSTCDSLRQLTRKIEYLNLDRTNMADSIFLRAILQGAREAIKLSDLSLEKIMSNTQEQHQEQRQELWNIPSALIAEALFKIKRVNIASIDFTEVQMQAMMEACSGDDARVEKLNVKNTDLRTVKEDTLRKLMIKLQKINMSDCRLSRAQLQQIMANLTQQSNLKVLKLSKVWSLESIEPMRFQAISSLRCLDISEVTLSRKAAREIIKAAKTSQTLRSLNVRRIYLRHVNPMELVQATKMLHHLDVFACKLHKKQIMELLRSTAKTGHPFFLNIGGNILTRVRNNESMDYQESLAKARRKSAICFSAKGINRDCLVQ